MEKIIRKKRFCNLCSGRQLGEEYHYIFECSKFTNERKLYIDYLNNNRPTVIKLYTCICTMY